MAAFFPAQSPHTALHPAAACLCRAVCAVCCAVCCVLCAPQAPTQLVWIERLREWLASELLQPLAHHILTGYELPNQAIATCAPNAKVGGGDGGGDLGGGGV